MGRAGAKTRKYKKVASTFILLFLAGSSCAPIQPSVSKTEKAVSRLASGQTVGEIDSSHGETHPEASPTPAPSSAVPPGPEVSPVTSSSDQDPCPDVAKPEKGASAEAMSSAMISFLGCLKELVRPALVVDAAIDYYKHFVMPAGEKPLSGLSDSELQIFLNSHRENAFSLFGESNDAASRIRNRFSNEELAELLQLSLRRGDEFSRLEGKFYAALDQRKNLIDFYSSADRWALLLAMRATSGDSDGRATAVKLAKIVNGAGLKTPELSQFPSELLHPFAILSVIANAKTPMSKLDLRSSPFTLAAGYASEFSGGPDRLEKLAQDYRFYRDQDDSAKIPEHVASTPDAVHVAFIDNGVDYVKFPEIGEFLGQGGADLSSHDYADHGSLAWAPMLGDLAHGTGTMATLLTLIARETPEVLEKHQLDLAMWKAGSTRAALAGAPVAGGHPPQWESRFPIPEALIDQLQSPGVKPKIVSASVTFDLAPFLAKIGKPGLLKDAPWLFVMAAGNEHVNIDLGGSYPACLGDLKPEQRNDARILCVGAIVQGVTQDQIARYTNYGSRVEVYTYDSFIKYCPAGTSCAAPAISAAVAMVAAKYPKLTPEQLKSVIVETAVEKELEVENSATGEKRRVRVFDPLTMMQRAFEAASKK